MIQGMGLKYDGGGKFSKLPIPGFQDILTPPTPEEESQRALATAMDNDMVRDAAYQYSSSPDNRHDYLARAEAYARRAAKIQNKAAIQRARNAEIRIGNSTVNIPNFHFNGGGGGDIGSFIRAIAGQESGGNYGVVNRDSGALGKYQIMPSNIAGSGGWDQEALGRNISTQFFLNHPRAQERIARYMLRKYYNNYGARGAASAWYSGDPNRWRERTPQGGYPSVREYVNQILERMGR